MYQGVIGKDIVVVIREKLSGGVKYKMDRQVVNELSGVVYEVLSVTDVMFLLSFTFLVPSGFARLVHSMKGWGP